jgi:hypothetical protein
MFRYLSTHSCLQEAREDYQDLSLSIFQAKILIFKAGMIAYERMLGYLLLSLWALASNSVENYFFRYPSLMDLLHDAEQVTKVWQIYALKYLILTNCFLLALKNLSFSLAVGTQEESSRTLIYNSQES